MLKPLIEFVGSYRQYLGTAPRMNRSQIQQLQAGKLKGLLEHARQHVPMMQNHLARLPAVLPDDFEALAGLMHTLPPLDKSAYRAWPEAARVSAVYPSTDLVTESSSGTSGQPFAVQMDGHYLRTRNLRFLRGLYATGYRWPMRLMLITGKAPVKLLRRRRWLYRGLTSQPETLCASLREFRPDVLYGCATPLRLLARHIQQTGQRIPLPRIVISTAETLSEQTRRTLESTFQAPVYDFYGMTEMGLIGWECVARQGYHVAEDSILIERLPWPLKADDIPPGLPVSTVAEGSSARDARYRLLYTNLDLKATPLLRFDSGDLAAGWQTATCTCGSRLPRVERFEGRRVDAILRPDGQSISPYEFTTILETVPGVRGFRLTQQALTTFRVEVETMEGSVPAEIRQIIGSRVGSLAGDNCQIEVDFVDQIHVAEGRKFKPVESALASS